MRRRRLAALALLAAAPAFSYYHFVHFVDGRRLVERFDLGALTDGVVSFYVSSERPNLIEGDSYEGLLSQVRQALAVWDGAPGSALGVRFGGVTEGPLPGNAPAAEIVFAELPPGVLGLGGPTELGDPRADFIPIQRAQVVLSRDLAAEGRRNATFSETFFNTLVHEIGHALGLQHTLSSAAMSTAPTRATTRTRPLAFDDLAGLATLYPREGVSRLLGSIRGRVRLADGRPAPLASVAAVHPGGTIVTALGDPDGSFRLQALLPGEHLLYVTPLPPATQAGLGPANIVAPQGPNAESFAAPPLFETVFYGGSREPAASTPVAVRAGEETSNIDFEVRGRSEPALGTITTFSFPGNGAPGAHPAFLQLSEREDLLLAIATRLAESLPSLSVEALAPAIPVLGVQPYGRDARFVEIRFGPAPFLDRSQLHLLFRLADDLAILPTAAYVTDQPAPIVHWLAPEPALGPRAWRVRGDGFDGSSQVFFDGAPARLVRSDLEAGELVVEAPPAPPGHQAVATVGNSDGQTSGFTLPDGNVTLRYPGGAAPEIEISGGGAAGSDVVVDVRARFLELDEDVGIGVGTSDVAVRRVERLAPDRARAIVSIRSDAAPGTYPVTVTTGLAALVSPGAFEVQAALTLSADAPVLAPDSLVNSASGRPEVAPGTLASLFGERLLAPGAASDAVRVTFDGAPATVLAATPTQINLLVPESLQAGPTELRVFNGQAESQPLPVVLESVAPGLFWAEGADGAVIGSERPLTPGEPFSVLATGLGSSSASFGQASRSSAAVTILIGESRLAVERIEPAGAGLFRIFVQAAETSPGPDGGRVTLLVDGRPSNSLELPTAAP